MSADIATATQFAGESKRHIFDFAPAMLDGEVIQTGSPPQCTITTESGSGRMVCISILRFDDTQVFLSLRTETPGRYLVQLRVDTEASGVDGITNVSNIQNLISKLRVTVI